MEENLCPLGIIGATKCAKKASTEVVGSCSKPRSVKRRVDTDRNSMITLTMDRSRSFRTRHF